MGTSGTRFTGTYDGDGHTITGLDLDGASRTAFIAYAQNATVSSLNLEVDLEGGERSGGVIGEGNGVIIDDVHVSGTVARPSTAASSGCLGGLVGYLQGNSMVRESSFTGTVSTSAGTGAGGLVGCTAATTSTRIERSKFDGTMIGHERVGGLVGTLTTSEIVDSYATGQLSASSAQLGGLVGYADRDSSDADQVAVTNSYAAVSHTGTALIGDLIGNVNSTTASASFSQSGQDDLTRHSLFSTAGWLIANGWEDIATSSNTWGICDGNDTPFLLWEHSTDPCPVNVPLMPLLPLTTSTTSAATSTPNTTTPSSPTSPTTPSTTTPSSVPTTPASSTITLEWQSPTMVMGRHGDLSVRIDFGGALASSRAPGSVATGATASITLEGASAGTDVVVTMFSTPTVLGTYRTGADGSLDGTIVIPSDATPGDHRLRLEAVDTEGEPVTMWLNLSVAAPVIMLPATGADGTMATMAWWMVAAGLLCVVVAGLGRRRHRLVR